MFVRYVLPVLAVCGLLFAAYWVNLNKQMPPASRPLVEPATAPEERSIAGAGLIEARRENIPVGTPVPGVVAEVFVLEGDDVTKGMPLFRIDSRELEAEVGIRQAQVDAARAQLRRLEQDPYSMDIPPAEEAVREAEARLEDTRIVRDRADRLMRKEAGTASEYDSARTKYVADEAAVRRARAELERVRVKAETWDEDIALAQARLAEAEAMLRQTEIEIDRRLVRATTDGVALQVNVRPGQFAALIWNEPLVILGDTGRLHVRVDIDEQDLPWFTPGTPAVAFLKGRPDGGSFPLSPVRVEPYVIPKQSLTGDNSERVDTRVLQVIYALPEKIASPLYVGQQMDVYIEMEKASGPVAGRPAIPGAAVARADVRGD
jgi:multidrug resistance efflux pump